LSPQARTVDERPIDMRDLRFIESLFETHHHYDQLFQVPLAIISVLVTENPESGLCRLGVRSTERSFLSEYSTRCSVTFSSRER
jgi:hypothetical protein